MADTDTTKLLLKQAKDAAIQKASGQLAQQNALILDAAKLRVKILDGSATDKDKVDYIKAKQKLVEKSDEINAQASLSADEVAAIRKDYRDRKLEAVKVKKGTVACSSTAYLMEYALRTQALNPYERERACDIEFYNLLNTIGIDTGDSLKQLKQLAQAIAATAIDD